MEKLKDFLSLLLFVTIIWHGIIWFSKKEKITGLFQEEPRVGYSWNNTNTTESRFFWESTDPKWTDGLKHPNINAYSSSEEGMWSPAFGYKFITQDDLVVDAVWDANQNYDNLKISTGEKEGTFYAYPGYLFPNPETSIDVVWTPGIINPNNPNLISGETEGSWIDNYQEVTDVEEEPGDHFAKYLIGHTVATITEKIFGNNSYSDKLHNDSNVEGVKGVIKVIEE